MVRSQCAGEELQPFETKQKRLGESAPEVERQPSLVTKLLLERGQVMARAETAERKCKRLEDEMKHLRSAIEQIRRERGQFAVAVNTLARKLAESSRETS